MTKSIPIRIGHSPDPDDAFMFYALAHKKIDMRGFEVEHVIEDIESLNQRALTTLSTPGVGMHATPGVSLEVTAVSCHAYAYLADKYAVMRSGASVGDNYGPILVTQSHKPQATRKDSCDVWRSTCGKQDVACGGVRVADRKIAVPGKLTTAYLVLQLYDRMAEIASGKDCPRNDVIARRPKADEAISFEAVFMKFDEIFDAVKTGEVDYGLIIHEGQITYEKHGLEKVLDLGQWWHERTKLPLPLGVDVIRKDLGEATMRSFAKLFKESIEYGLNHRKDALEYASQFGRGISGDLNDRFVAMYVNDRTIDIGEDGEAGFRRLLDEAYQAGIIPKKVELEFV